MTILAPAQIASYARQAGFSNQGLLNIVAIALAESGGNTTATHTAGNSAGVDRGLYQINSYYHPEVTNACAFDPACSSQAVYRISGNGSNFNAWATYTSGRYRAYLAAAQTGIQGSGGTITTQTPPQPQAPVRSAASNTYPLHQCTWWASERYHQLTGFYVPWMGNANQWAGLAPQFGWKTSNLPPTGVPSMISFSGGQQGSDTTYGHVAVVERINADGTVYTSNQNWNYTSNTTYVTFKPGPGVTFIWDGRGGGNTPPGLGTTSTPPASSAVGNPVGFAATLSATLGSSIQLATYIPFLDQVHQTLIETPGFYGIALALDEAEQFPGYLDLTNAQAQHLNVAGVDTGIILPDVNGMIRSIGATVTDNAIPFFLRSGVTLLGFILLIALIIKPVMSVAQTVAPFVE